MNDNKESYSFLYTGHLKRRNINDSGVCAIACEVIVQFYIKTK